MKLKFPYIRSTKNALASCFIISIFLGFLSFSPNADQDKLEKFKQTFKAFVNDTALAHASIGFALIDTETGKAVYEHNSNQSLTPASTLKIVTTGAALGILGEDYTFKTLIAYDSATNEICIIGGGDPTLGSDRVKGNLGLYEVIAKWQQAILNEPKTSNAKTVVSYSGRYERAMQPANWAWNDIGNYYGAGASGLSIHENYYTVTLNGSVQAGRHVEVIDFEPGIEGLKLESELKAGPPNSGDNAYIFGAPYENNRIIRGTIPSGSGNFKIKGSIPDPALFCAQELYKIIPKRVYPYLKNASSFSKSKSASGLLLLHTTVSPSLKDIVYHTNLKSVNLYAEHLLKECGYKVFKDGSTEAGIKAVTQFWKGKGVKTDGLFMKDGSGLTHSNAITASQLAQILASVKKETYFNSFYNSLPVAGESGAMKSMGDGTIISGKLRAKSGHMDSVRSYAGFTSTNKKYAFALIVNNYTCEAWEIKSKIEKVLIALDL